MIRGLDVSSAQGVVDRASVASIGCRFVFAKAGEGNRGHDPIFETPGMDVTAERAAAVTGRDPQYLANVAGAKAAGLYVGPYWFAYPLPHNGLPLRDPADQAKFAFDCAEGIGSHDGELPPMLDLEWPPPEEWPKWGCAAAQIRAWALAFLDAAEGYWGCKPVLYTYPYFWHAMAGAVEPRFADYPLCIASYPLVPQWPTETDQPIALPPWDTWTWWQWTGGKAKLPNGVPADFEVFNGDEAALAALCRSPT